MTTTAHRQATLDAIARDIRRCSEADARAARPASDWRMDALERAGELVVAGRLAESRKIAQEARQ